MPTFFVQKNNISDTHILIEGEDAKHISKSLRMVEGDKITLSDGEGTEYICEISGISNSSINNKILDKHLSEKEPSVEVSVYMAMSKGDKMDLIVQKMAELGVVKIYPFLSERCVSRPDLKSMRKKTERWQKIALEASKQCGRGKIPKVFDQIKFKEAVDEAKNAEMPLFLYENENNTSLKSVLCEKNFKTVSIVIGPEGGFAPEEAVMAIQSGLLSVSIGKRILRCETAPIAAVSCVMYQSGNF